VFESVYHAHSLIKKTVADVTTTYSSQKVNLLFVVVVDLYQRQKDEC
jgi:hypothetical protein